MSYTHEFVIAGLPQLQSGAFGHWRARRDHDKRWKELVHYGMVGHRPPIPLRLVELTCTRHSASGTPPDDDNLCASFKPLIDSLIGPVILDDGPEFLTAHYKWERCKRGEGHVVIEIREASPQSDPPL